MNNFLETKNAVFYNDRVFLKRGNKIIIKADIKEIYYLKSNVKNYFLYAKCMAIGYAYISLKKPTFFRKWYALKMDYDDVVKIPSILDVKLTIYE